MTYKAGLVGTGAVSDWHADAFEATERVELVAVADIEESALQEKASKWGIPKQNCYLDHTKMLSEEELDIVSVTTPTAFHREHTIDAAQIGNPDVVWCEKPIAASVKEGQEMVRACEETDTELVVNHVRRWAKPYMRLRQEISENEILGDLHTVHAQFKIELLRNGTHFVDTLYWLLDKKAVRVSGFLNEAAAFDSGDPTIDTEDYGGGGYLILDDGTAVMLDCAVPRESFSGWLHFTGSEGRLYFNESDEEIEYWNITDGVHETELITIFEDEWNKWSSAFRRAAASLVKLADGEGVNKCDGREALTVQEMIIALFISHYTGSDVNLPLEKPLESVSISSW